MANDILVHWFSPESKEQQQGVFKKLVLGDYKWLSYNEMDQKIGLIDHSLMAHACACPRQNVVILAETRIEWMLVAQTSLRISITVVTL